MRGGGGGGGGIPTVEGLQSAAVVGLKSLGGAVEYCPSLNDKTPPFGRCQDGGEGGSLFNLIRDNNSTPGQRGAVFDLSASVGPVLILLPKLLGANGRTSMDPIPVICAPHDIFQYPNMLASFIAPVLY